MKQFGRFTVGYKHYKIFIRIIFRSKLISTSMSSMLSTIVLVVINFWAQIETIIIKKLL